MLQPACDYWRIKHKSFYVIVVAGACKVASVNTNADWTREVLR